MSQALVGVVLGSRADFNMMKRGLEALRVMGVPYVFELASAHRTPERLERFANEAQSKGLAVIICAAGGAATTASVLASHTNIPVIAVPVDSTPLRGQDALFSMVQTPPGIPVATVGINSGENAALLATQILALRFPKYRDVLAHRRAQMTQRLDRAQKELMEEYPDLCHPTRTAPVHVSRGADEETDPGSEDVTPEPTPDEEERSDPIRPGAMLSPRANAAAGNLGSLVETPLPQEPGIVTEDDALSGEGETVAPHSEEILPPPPSDQDLSPETGTGTPQESFSANTEGKTESEQETPEPTERQVPTKVFQLDPREPDEDVLSHAMMVLLEGGVVAFPTDTVYGLAVDAMNPEAVRRLYDVKGREVQRKSLSVLIDSPDSLDSLVREVPPALEAVLETYWPGALTVLFFKHPSVLSSVSDSNSIAIRIPNNPIPMGLIGMINRPLAVINAAVGDSPAAVTAEDVVERLGGKIDCVLDAGPCRAKQTSTVLSVLSEPFEVIREGAVPVEDLRKMLGSKMRE